MQEYNRMTYSLSNSKLSLSVQKTGVELCSVQSQQTGTEYIWQADPDIWGSHAPVLFPIIGALKDGTYFYEGETYSLPKHGLIRHSNKARLTHQTENSLLFTRTWDSDSLKQYPFKFEFQTRYSLSDSTVSVDHTVINHGNGSMYFSLGGHPAFNCPLHENESYSDYALEFEQVETAPAFLLNSDGLVTDKKRPTLNNTSTLSLRKHLFDDDALIFRNLRSRAVNLVSRKSGDILTINYIGFPYLGVWAKPGAAFVCIEPWQGIADTTDTTQDISQKEGMMCLKSEEVHRASYSIEFNTLV